MKNSSWILIIAVLWLFLAIVRYFVSGADGVYYFDLGASLFLVGIHHVVRELELLRAVKRD